MKTEEKMRIVLHVHQSEKLLNQVLRKDKLICTETAEITDAVQGILLLTIEYCHRHPINGNNASIVMDFFYFAFNTLSGVNEQYFDACLDSVNTELDDIKSVHNVKKVLNDIIIKLQFIRQQIEAE